MICPSCGVENPAADLFCKRCGRPLGKSEARGAVACWNHKNRRASTTCGQCGARLCDWCAVEVRGLIFCRACAGVEEPTEQERIDKLAVVDARTAPRAGFGTRLTAAAVDWIILFGAGLVLALVFFVIGRALPGAAGIVGRAPGRSWLFWLAGAVLAAGYFVLLTAGSGQTLGKQTMSIAVVREDGTVPGIRAAGIAFLGSIASFAVFGLGYLIILSDPSRRTWHDRWAGTLVVSLDPPVG